MGYPTDEFFKRNRPFSHNGPASFADSHYPKMTIPVRLSSLQATQKSYDPQKVEKMESTEPIMLWKDSRGYRIIDGHHRAIAAMQRGDKTIEAHVWMSEN